jgi:hypothetical protein
VRKNGQLDQYPLTRRTGECTVADCYGKRYGHGLCAKHFMRAKRNGTLDQYSRDDIVSEEPDRGRPQRDPICTEDACNSPHQARGLCQFHYNGKHHQSRKSLGLARPRQPRAASSVPLDDQCLGPDCDRRQVDHGLCRVHLNKVQRLDALDDWIDLQSTLIASSDSA